MNKKILNPQKYYSNDFLNSLPIKEIDDQKFRVLVIDERRKITSCQCYRDCSCYGSVVGEIVTYYRRIQYDNTSKAFYSDYHYIPLELRKIN